MDWNLLKKNLNESIGIFSSVFGQDVHEVWEQWSTSVLIVKGSIWEWQYNSIFLPGNTKYLCRELPAKDLVGFATEGFVCEVPISSHLFIKNWIKTTDLLHDKLPGIWNVGAFEASSIEACLEYFVVGKLLLAVTQDLESTCFLLISTTNYAARKEAEIITLKIKV